MARGGGLHVEVDVGVRVQRDGDVGVPQPLLDDPGVASGPQGKAGVGRRLTELVAARRLGPLVGRDLDRERVQEQRVPAAAARSCGPTARMTTRSGAGQAFSMRSVP